MTPKVGFWDPLGLSSDGDAEDALGLGGCFWALPGFGFRRLDFRVQGCLDV